MSRISLTSLGCDKNFVDAEHMLARLYEKGHTLTQDSNEAEVLIVNTCAFIDAAKEESIETILDLARSKEEGRAKALIVTGCLAQRYAEEIQKELPEVDAVVGVSSYDEIAWVVERVLGGDDASSVGDADRTVDDSTVGRVHSTGLYYAYLKIAEGCDKHCTYCAIPAIRGRYRSVPVVSLMKEARQLARAGVEELILVAQETTLYGTDLYGEKSLPGLLEKLSAIDGIRRIRLLYAYPEEIDEALIEAMATLPKVVPYLDIPIQHCNDEILRRMGRRTTKAEILSLIGRLRAAVPQIALRTTVICGFPGETQAQHEELLDFLREARFDRMGAFCYSAEEGTPAAGFSDQVPAETAKAWREEVLLLQQEISLSIHQSMVGTLLPVVTEGYLTEEGIYCARSFRDAPDIDGLVWFDGKGRDLLSGREVEVRITEAGPYDLMGELED